MSFYLLSDLDCNGGARRVPTRSDAAIRVGARLRRFAHPTKLREARDAPSSKSSNSN
jgi:hypothetical protein